jgi:hypothetical protein
MATQLLFYETAVPLSLARHGDWAIEPRDYSFSQAINSVPLTTIEFPAAAAEYSIVFAGQSGALMPVAILGVRPAQNLFVTADGKWDAKYVPAFVRRYPFVFASADQGKSFTLCIDEAFAGFNREGRGKPLFNGDKKASPYTENVLKFVKGYQVEFQRTQEFCRLLEQLDLLQPMQAQIQAKEGDRMSLGGFQAVDRAKLKALPPAKLAELARSDALESIFLHLQSMRNFSLVRGRLDAASASATAQPAAGSAKASASKPKAPAAKAPAAKTAKPKKKPAAKQAS